MATRQQQLEALARRKARLDTRIEWFDRQVRQNIRVGMAGRLRFAAVTLRDAVVVNVSIPVVKTLGRNRRGQFASRVDPESRSKRGEFPRADTTRLLKDIFWQMEGTNEAIVGTTLFYGLILETRLDRSFLRRTLLELQVRLARLLATDAGGRLPGQV